ncbi:MAG: hypothetical protein IJC07_00350 [Clostridia bacterium]|nr:hypothetical protein [Clostridia bacterium]
MRYEKVFVQVTAKFSVEGGMTPLEILWRDGKRYVIDKVKFTDRAPSKVGGMVTKRYTVLIGGQERYLYFDKYTERWFVEKRYL